MTGAAVALGFPFAETLDLDPREQFPTFQIPDFKSQQVIDVHITERLAAVDRKRPNHIAEGPDLTNDFMRPRIGHPKNWRFQSCEIGEPAVGTHNRVVRAGISDDLLQDFA